MIADDELHLGCFEASGTRPGRKVEGFHASLNDGGVGLLLVTDADDADVPAQLLEARLA